MQIFISYASEQRAEAEAIAVELRHEGHSVFLDRDRLVAGASYTDPIREAIGRSDLFIFLISTSSLTEERFTRTELKLAEEKWPSASGRLLPVLLEDLPIGGLPPYLKSVSVLRPEGDLAADTAAAVERLRRQRRFVPGRRLAIWAGLLALGAVAFLAWSAVAPSSIPANPGFSFTGAGGISPGTTATFSLTNVRPAIAPRYQYRCIVDYSALTQVVRSIDYDDRCEEIKITARPLPWSKSATGYRSLVISVTDIHGRLIWQKKWRLSLLMNYD